MSGEDWSNKPTLYQFTPMKDFSLIIQIGSYQDISIRIGTPKMHSVIVLPYEEARHMIETLCDMYGIVWRDKYIGEK